ncbi:MAG: hypothetical protein J5935_04675 [Lachnospiraceae bacterium]|nr:hypothetical protein [Lachnospiraceae bacterium]
MKKKMTRVLAILMTAVFLTACAGQSAPAAEPAEEPAEEVTEESAEETTEEAAAESAEEAAEETTEEAAAEEETTEEAASEEAPEEETAYADYVYPGDDAVLKAAYEYMAKEIGSQYMEGQLSIPSVRLVHIDDTEKDAPKVFADFWAYQYDVDGDTLKTVSGGSHPGCMQLKAEGDGYVVEAFEVAADGSEFTESAKKIFGDYYEDFSEMFSDDVQREEQRLQDIADFVTANGLEVTKVEDYGWDPVEIPLVTQEPMSIGGMTGGWEIAEGEDTAIPAEVEEAFAKATEGLLGNDLTPIAYLGSQVVSGKNYALLCKSTKVTANPVTGLQVVIVYVNTKGEAEIKSIEDFKIEDYNN